VRKIQSYFQDPYFLLFWILISIRAYFNAYLPLLDKTEARYGEIARLMTETGNWVTPQIDYGIPFWAKPPLSTWASASSISLFGNHEFFVRLPYLLIILIFCFFISRYRTQKKDSIFLVGTLVLTLPEFYLHAGVVSTDTFLLFSIALTFFSFWEAMQKEAKPYWGYLFFVGIGLGLLAKGPIIGILTLPPIVAWLFFTKNSKVAWQKAPWIGGIALTAIISLPWYFWAEARTPGFIDYFIVGEHFERYFNSDWQGDRYGFPKQQPYGMSWVFLLIFLLPWSIVLIRLFVSHWKKCISHPWTLFLTIWFIWTPFFFTSSTSLIHPYILPSTLPAALLISHFWSSDPNFKKVVIGSAALPVLLFLIAISGYATPLFENNTDKFILNAKKPKTTIYSLDHKSYSSQFYTEGKIELTDTLQLKERLQNHMPFFILIEHRQWETLSDSIKDQLSIVAQHSKRGLYNTYSNNRVESSSLLD
jgi:4-amino-4-deoxy-L-arabinose transferase-like glycosyltransferase